MKKILIIKTSPNLKSEIGSLSSKIVDKIIASLNIEINITEHILDNDPYFEKILTATNFSSFFDGKSDLLIKELFDNDIIIFSTPTINFGIPSLLKNYFDKILQASKTFKFKYDKAKGESKGLLEGMNKKAIIINTQGAPADWYPFTSTIMQIKGCLNFIGINDIEQLCIHGTKTQKMSGKSHADLIEEIGENIKKIGNFIEKN